jgi:hypothetical protein
MVGLSEIDTGIHIFDSHWPFHIDHNPLLDFIQDTRPKYITLGGDIWDLGFLSHHHFKDFKRWGTDEVIRKLNEEREGFTAFLEQIRNVAKKADITYLLGNHEDWIQDFVNEFPQVNETTIHTLLPLSKLAIVTVPVGRTYNIGHLYFAHGENYGTANPAKRAVETSHKSIMIGHHHTDLVWSVSSDVDDAERYKALCVPCMCKKDLEYANHKPNRWSTGFGWSCHKRSGNFSAGVYTTSPNGHFMVPMKGEYE